MKMGNIVYGLCALTSMACAVLLVRGYLTTRSRLLLWSALCFCGLTLANLGLYADLVVFPDGDLRLVRTLLSLGSSTVLLGGLIWESR